MNKELFDQLIEDGSFSVEITYTIFGGEEITEYIHITSTDKDTLYYGIYEDDKYFECTVRFENITNVLY